MSCLVKTNFFEAHSFKSEDAPVVASWMSNSPMDLFMISSSLTFPVKPEILIEKALKSDHEEHRFYSVFFAESNNHAGYFEIKNISKRHKTGTGAHTVLSPEYRGKGLGKDLIELISKVGFSVLELHRISLSVHTVNRAAIAAYIKAGYSFEGLIREVLFFNGKRYSLYQMSLLNTEWSSDSKK